MSRIEYEASKHLSLHAHEFGGNAFYSLLMSAMREADTDNLEKLKAAFPETCAELVARYNAPGGVLWWEKGGP